MPANFNPTLPINNGEVQWPAGPYFPVVGEVLLRIDVWIMQKATLTAPGAIQATYRDAFPNTSPMNWTTTDLVHREGDFQAGAALGTAVAIARTQANVFTHYWWTEEVTLV